MFCSIVTSCEESVERIFLFSCKWEYKRHVIKCCLILIWSLVVKCVKIMNRIIILGASGDSKEGSWLKLNWDRSLYSIWQKTATFMNTMAGDQNPKLGTLNKDTIPKLCMLWYVNCCFYSECQKKLQNQLNHHRP